MYTVLLVIHTILVLFLIGIVLIQRSDSDGLSGLGGGGGNQFMTGRSSANLLTRTTAMLAGAFMVTSLILAVMSSRNNSGSIIDTIEQQAPLAVEQPTESSKEQPVSEPVPEPVTQEPVVPKPE